MVQLFTDTVKNMGAFTRPRMDSDLTVLIINMIIRRSATGPTYFCGQMFEDWQVSRCLFTSYSCPGRAGTKMKFPLATCLACWTYKIALNSWYVENCPIECASLHVSFLLKLVPGLGGTQVGPRSWVPVPGTSWEELGLDLGPGTNWDT